MKIAVAVTGASGSIYAKVLLERLSALLSDKDEAALVLSKNASTVWKLELSQEVPEFNSFKIYQKTDFMAPFASGSAGFDAMVICPCSMGTLGRIAAGLSDDLITRAADVMLKERKKLILVPRETPFNLIQLRNMTNLTEAGAIICPASPSFYSNPQSFDQLAATVVDRIIDLIGIPQETFRWNSEKDKTQLPDLIK
ncbi:MAG: UbiX family flavin prenyltransferase [Bacteroidia bacterium]